MSNFDDFSDIRGQPCLLLMVNDNPTQGGNQLLPVPPGANLWITEAFGNDAQTYPLVLAGVTRKQLKFKCACGNKDCDRTLVFTSVASGTHNVSQRGDKLKLIKGS